MLEIADADDPHCVGRFKNALRIGAHLNDPVTDLSVQSDTINSRSHVMTVVRAPGVTPHGQPYQVIPLVLAPSLFESGPFRYVEIGWVCELAEELFLALAFVHARRVVHRQVSPPTIFARPEGSPHTLLHDFTNARIMGEAWPMDEPGRMELASIHVPREQLLNPASCTEKSDIYAAGMTIFQMLTERSPWEKLGIDFRRAIVSRVPPPAPRLDQFGSFNPVIVDAIARCLLHDPSERPDALSLAQVFAKAKLAVPKLKPK